MADKQRTVSIIIQARNEASKALNSVLSSLSSFKGIAIVVAAAGAAMAIALKKVTDAASEQEKADVALAQALTTVGQNTEATRANLAAFIDEMEDLTKVNDETISSVLGLLTQFGRLQGEGLKRATRAVLDYSAATGIDAVTAATQLSNVIVKGTGRLAGIKTQFDQGASAAERYNQVIRQLEQLHGAAEARGKTFEGTLAQIGIEFERLEEVIGKNIIESEALRTVISVFASLIETATGIVERHGGAFRTLITLWAQGAIFITKLAVQFATWEAQLLAANIRTAEFVLTLSSLVIALGAVAAKKLGIDPEVLGRAAGAAAKLIPDLERARSVVVGLGAAGEEALKALDEALKNLSTGAVGVGKVVPQVGTDLKGVVGAAEQLDEIMRQLGGPTLSQLESQARAVDDALRLVAEAQAASANPEQYDAIIEQLIEMSAGVRGWTTDLSAAAGALSVTRDLMQEVQESAQDAAIQGAVQLGDAFVDAAFGAKVSWGQAIRQILAGIAKAIVQSLILKAIQMGLSFVGGGGGAAAGAGLAISGAFGGGGARVPPAQHGGEVRGGTPGWDSVLAALTPGEIVLPRSLAENFDALADWAQQVRDGSGARGGTAGRPALLGAFQIFPRRDERDIAEIIEGITEFVERRGYRLVASEVLA